MSQEFKSMVIGSGNRRQRAFYQVKTYEQKAPAYLPMPDVTTNHPGVRVYDSRRKFVTVIRTPLGRLVTTA